MEMASLRHSGSSLVNGSSFHFLDDACLTFGNIRSAPNVQMAWDTLDADANHFKLSLPVSDNIDVPIFSVGIGTKGADLGFFNGDTQPAIAVLSAGNADWFKFTHEIEDGTTYPTFFSSLDRMRFRPFGNQVHFTSSRDGASIRMIVRSNGAGLQSGFELGRNKPSRLSSFFMRLDENFNQAGYFSTAVAGFQYIFADSNNRDFDQDIAVQNDPLAVFKSILNPNTDNAEHSAINYRCLVQGTIDNADPLLSSLSMETDRIAPGFTFKFASAFQNASNTTNANGQDINCYAPDGNLLHTVASIGADWRIHGGAGLTADDVGKVVAVTPLETESGRYKNVVRITSADSPYTIPITVEELFVDTDGGVVVVNLPPLVNKRHLRILNTGSSGNNVTLNPDGGDLLNGDNAGESIFDSEKFILTGETTEGWW